MQASYPTPVSGLRKNVLYDALTMAAALPTFAMECSALFCHVGRMQRLFSQAGGCFIALCILGGFAIGIWSDQAMKGVLIGTALGIAVALALWAAGRSRSS